MREKVKIISVGILVAISLFLTYYFHFVVKTPVFFTHLMYIPIVLSSIYWRRAGIYLAVFLGVYLMISQALSSLDIALFDFTRPIMFVVIAAVVTYIINQNKEYSEKLKQTEQVVKLNKELNELNATKDKLFSIIAHDLKNPFNSILGFSSLTYEDLRQNKTGDLEMYCKEIHSNAKNTLHLLDNLLEWANSQTGNIKFKPEYIRPKNVVMNMVNILEASAILKNISIKVNIREDAETYADINMLQTILRNLISNAIKFTYPGGQIDISTEQKQDNIEFKISDNGIGIAEEEQNKLFIIGSNSPTKGTADEKGSGMGLILCKEFVERQGGKIWVKSHPDKGSEFIFTIPRKD